MQFLIITGLSGAGKSRAADILEDLDYYCVDNMPVALMPRFAELCIATGGRYEKVALVTDVREKNGFGELLKTLDQLNDMDCGCRILYMDCDIRTLVRRYKESRRPHPLSAPGLTVEDAIRKEERAARAYPRARGLYRQHFEPHPRHAAEPPVFDIRAGRAQARSRHHGDVLRL